MKKKNSCAHGMSLVYHCANDRATTLAMAQIYSKTEVPSF